MVGEIVISSLIKKIRRSQPYAFSVDGSSGELVAAGGTETETQVMVGIMVIRNVMLNVTLVMVVGGDADGDGGEEFDDDHGGEDDSAGGT